MKNNQGARCPVNIPKGTSQDSCRHLHSTGESSPSAPPCQAKRHTLQDAENQHTQGRRRLAGKGAHLAESSDPNQGKCFCNSRRPALFTRGRPLLLPKLTPLVTKTQATFSRLYFTWFFIKKFEPEQCFSKPDGMTLPTPA